MRDRLIHGYGDSNLMTLWDTVKQRIPVAKPQIQQILAGYEGRE
jgi:uncharacterized protein with HEPN domain